MSGHRDIGSSLPTAEIIVRPKGDKKSYKSYLPRLCCASSFVLRNKLPPLALALRVRLILTNNIARLRVGGKKKLRGGSA